MWSHTRARRAPSAQAVTASASSTARAASAHQPTSPHSGLAWRTSKGSAAATGRRGPSAPVLSSRRAAVNLAPARAAWRARLAAVF